VQSLLQDPMLEEAIRAGDCIAMLVEHFYERGQMREAYTYLKEMEDRNIQPHPYIDAEILNVVYKAVGKQPGSGGGSGSGPGKKGKAADIFTNDDQDDRRGGGRGGGEEEEDEVVEEEVEEEVVSLSE
jgi:pentatricopeptide repeat protein